MCQGLWKVICLYVLYIWLSFDFEILEIDFLNILKVNCVIFYFFVKIKLNVLFVFLWYINREKCYLLDRLNQLEYISLQDRLKLKSLMLIVLMICNYVYVGVLNWLYSLIEL